MADKMEAAVSKEIYCVIAQIQRVGDQISVGAKFSDGGFVEYQFPATVTADEVIQRFRDEVIRRASVEGNINELMKALDGLQIAP